jgi:hypothetical protein
LFTRRGLAVVWAIWGNASDISRLVIEAKGYLCVPTEDLAA